MKYLFQRNNSFFGLIGIEMVYPERKKERKKGKEKRHYLSFNNGISAAIKRC
jgi:hypothetical protein